MAESASEPEQLFTALTTEHSGLQGSRSTTTSEAGSRSSLYVSAVSSTLYRRTEARLFLLAGNDDFPGVARNVSLTPGFLQPFITASTMVAVINGVVGGAALALASTRCPARRSASASARAILALANVALSIRWSGRRYEQAERAHVSIFPSPGTLVEAP